MFLIFSITSILLTYFLVNGFIVPNIIETSLGLVQGRSVKTVGLGKTYYAFQGIPYAEPPVGELRFEPPQPKKPWNGVLEATRDGQMCTQLLMPVLGSEDCLYISVYTPQIIATDLLPVIVYIHGGGLLAVSSNYELNAPDYLLEKDVIFVAFNYRLSIFGFLSTYDSVVPGNNGFKDQVLALEWVQENIKYFGGDPNRVTLFGQSSGAVSVSYHLESPLSQGLFHRAIMDSGVSFSTFEFSSNMLEITKDITDALNIHKKSSRNVVEALRQVDSITLQNQALESTFQYFLDSDPRRGNPFSAVVEVDHPGAFHAKSSSELIETGQFAQVPCLLGFNTMEIYADLGLPATWYFSRFDLNPSLLTPLGMNANDTLAVGQEIKQQFFGPWPLTFSGNEKIMKFISDDQFVRPIRKYAELLAKWVPTYLYRFSYEGNSTSLIHQITPGTQHCEELEYIFATSYKLRTENDELTRERMVTMWTNFAKTGNPTPTEDPLLQNVTWKTSDENHSLLDIGVNLQMAVVDDDSMKLWDALYEKYGNPPYDTY